MEQIERSDSSPKVGFLIAGTQRGGTTTLRDYLFHHPELCMPAKKELHFFDDDRFWRSQSPDYAPYHEPFPVKPSHRLLGEATPIYMYWKPGLARIRDYNPKMKLIMMLRNPITRAYSHWNFERRAGRESLPFREALLAEPSRTEKARPAQLRNASYIQRGMYTEQLNEVWRFFPPEQTLILRFDDLRRALEPLCIQIARFLAITPFAPVGEIISHAKKYENPLSADDRRYLAGIFEPEIKSLERLLGWDCSDWLADSREP